MVASKSRITKHILAWLAIWLIQSLLFSGGSNLNFYLVKNIAIVSLQAGVVYLNWMILPHIKWFELKSLILYLSVAILTIYLTFSISFEVIDFVFTIFFPEIVRINTGQLGWWPKGFWRIISGSAPYSIALFTSTIIYLINSNRKIRQEIVNQENGSSIDFLTIKDGKTIHRLKKEEILYVEGLKEYVNWCTGQKKITTLHSLQKIESLLSDDGFIRTHKSYIVNTAHVTRVKHNLLEIPGKDIPIGRSYREKVSGFFQTNVN